MSHNVMSYKTEFIIEELKPWKSYLIKRLFVIGYFVKYKILLRNKK
jgi:hypothetical protein